MKSANILLGLVACAAMCACTDNDIAGNGTGGGSVFTGDKAYMVVNISEAGVAETKADDGGFTNGDSSENAVKNIYFYFYASDGTLEAYTNATTTWNDGTEGSSVELSGDRVVVLSGLTDKEFPSYVVTLINKPDDFTPPATLDAMGEALASTSGTGITTSVTTSDDDSDDDTDTVTEYFTMSTSSYFDNTTANSGGSVHDNTYYYATKVSDANFTTEPIDETSDDVIPVKIYVERVAAKVYVHTGITKVRISGGTYKRIGYNTSTGKTEIISFTFHTTDRSTTADYELLYRFTGGGLNGTEKQSYMVKHIDSSWNDNAPWTGWSGDAGWNDVENYRSYWGKSVHYDDNTVTYPTSGLSVTGNECLNYVSANQLHSITEDDDWELDIDNMYCAENTNTTNIITNKNSSALTNIIATAQLYIQENHGEPQVINDFVSCASGLYYTAAYLDFALYEVQIIFPIYVESNGEYTEITTDYLELTDLGDGYVKVSLKSDYSDDTFYGDEAGNITYTAKDVQNLIDEQFNRLYGYEANEYKNGMMYYNIPIEHLNNPTTDEIEEAQYGVVRNHYYDVKITDIDNLGWGIINPDEPIIPQIETTKYYVGAEITISAWHVVKQGVDLY